MQPVRRLVSLCGVLVAALVATACGGNPQPKASTPTTAPPGTPGASATATGGLAYNWARVHDPALSVGGGPTSTIAGMAAPVNPGDSWLAVGSRTTSTGGATATVWTSPDGTSWTASPLPGGGPVTQARGVARLGTTTVVVGSAGSGSGQRAAVWISKGQGRPFRAVVDASIFVASPVPAGNGTPSGDDGGGAAMDHVAAGALGVFASGLVQGRAAIWYSTNGARWTRLAGAERVVGAADQPEVNALLVAPNGVWAAGGVRDGTDQDGAVWTSTDGIHWSRVNSAKRAFTGDGDHIIEDIASVGTGFVAVGAVRTGPEWMPASWISPDGVSWSEASEAFPMTPVPMTEDLGTKVAAVNDVVGGGLVAVGGSPSAQRVWTSSDGLSWTELALPAGAATARDWHLGLVAAAGTTTVVADDVVGEPHLLVDRGGSWQEVTAAPNPFGKPGVEAMPTSLVSDNGRLYLAVDVLNPGAALGHDSRSAMVLSSPDGSSWTLEASGGPFAGHRLHSLLPVTGGLVAAGGQARPPGQAPSATLWSSRTSPSSALGQAWVAAAETPATFGGGSSPPEDAVALARVGLDVVAVGDKQDQAVGWVNAGAGGWRATGSLDTSPAVAAELPQGACAGPDTVVAVGTGQGGTPGQRALAWSSSRGDSWQAASVTPASTPGEQERMTGCLTTGNGFLAYGESAGAVGTTDPALWQSSDGTNWTRQDVSAFSGEGGGAVTDLALRGTTWLAVSGGATPPPPGASAGSTVGLWRSSDAGRTWQRLPTAATPWSGAIDSQVDQVGFAGASAVVVGQVDGQLAVWLGGPAQAAPAPPSG